MAFSNREIEAMSASEYRQHLRDPEFLRSVDAIEVPTELLAGTRAKVHRQAKDYTVRTSEDVAADRAAKAAQKVLQSAEQYTQQTLLKDFVLQHPLADGFLTFLNSATGQHEPLQRVSVDLFKLIIQDAMADVKMAYAAFCDRVNQGRDSRVRDAIIDFMDRQEPPLDPRSPFCWHKSYALLEAAKALPTQIAAEEQAFAAQENARRTEPKRYEISYNGLTGRAAFEAMPSDLIRQKMLTDSDFKRAADELFDGGRRMPEAPTESPEKIRANNYHDFLNKVVVTDPETNKQYSENDLQKLPAQEERRLRRILEGGSPVLKAWRELKDTQAAREAERATYGQ